ncbi:ABC transporter permease [Corynebacterium pacaense]|uniref:ABC transporter permease n=1 Tax=Corynebacterium pacaense TaxID=1816684 RepID=UPI0009BC6A20|nr:ABC transporter permease [Corynebacterium pacaense]
MLLTLLSVVLGTAFLCGSLLLTNSLERSFVSITDAGVAGVDVGVVGSQSNLDGVPLAVVEQLQRSPDIRAVNIVGDGPGTPSGTQKAGLSALILTDPSGQPLQAGSSGAHPFSMYPSGDWVRPEPQIIKGSSPHDDGEVIINESAARRGGISPGDEVTVITPTERITVSVSGIFRADSDVAGWIGVGFTEERYLELFTDGRNASQVVIAVRDGVDPMSVRNRIGQQFPTLTPLLPEQIIERTTGDSVRQLEFITYILIAFAGIALVVGAFIIANTFAMIVARRTSEFALLRSLGASSFQIGFSVVMEAAVISIIGALGGVAVGFGVVLALVAVLNHRGSELSSIEMALTPGSFILPIIFAIASTVLSALDPARRAGMLPPVQSFSDADARSGVLSRARYIVASVLLTLGTSVSVAGALVSAINGSELPSETRLGMVGAGTVLGFLGLALAGAPLIRVASGTIGVIVCLPFRAIGRLARRNVLRNPRRSATTALAVTLSVGLVSCVGVIGATTRASVFSTVESSVLAPFVLDSIGGTTIPGQPSDGSRSLSLSPAVAKRAADTPGVTEVGTLMTVSMAVDGWDNESTTVFDGDLADFLDVAIRQGSAPAGDQPGVMISTTYASQSDLKVGDLVTVSPYGTGDGIVVPVTGIYAETGLLGHLVVTMSAAQRVITSEGDFHRSQVFINTDGTQSEEAMRSELTSAVAEFLIVQVKSKDEFRGGLGTQINQLLGIVYGLLALAVIIAVLGIVNTLVLSLSERTRELGVLRATGVQRSQIQLMVTLESVVISIHGAIMGILGGTIVGWAVVSALRSRGMAPVEIPWTQIGLMLIASVVIGSTAAYFPARRAGRTNPLEAIAD